MEVLQLSRLLQLHRTTCFLLDNPSREINFRKGSSIGQSFSANFMTQIDSHGALVIHSHTKKLGATIQQVNHLKNKSINSKIFNYGGLRTLYSELIFGHWKSASKNSNFKCRTSFLIKVHKAYQINKNKNIGTYIFLSIYQRTNSIRKKNRKAGHD